MEYLIIICDRTIVSSYGWAKSCGSTKSEPENAQFLMILNEPLPNYHHHHSSSRPFDRWSQINPSLGGTHYKALHPNLSFGDRSRLLKVIESQRSQKVKWFSMIMSSSPSFDSIFSTRLLLPALTNSIRGQDSNIKLQLLNWNDALPRSPPPQF